MRMCAIFITFPGNCKKALTFYQTCFGGFLQFEPFEKALPGYMDQPLLVGSLVSDSIIIHGSDLVHDEGRKLGNYMAIFMQFQNSNDRKLLIKKLETGQKGPFLKNHDSQRLIELTDAFDVRWVLGL